MSCVIFQLRTADRNSRNVTLYLTDLTSNVDLQPCCLRREDRLRSLCIKSALAEQILAYLTNWDIYKTPYAGVAGMLLSMKGNFLVRGQLLWQCDDEIYDHSIEWERTSACEGTSDCRYQSIFDLTHPPNPCMKCEMKLEIDHHIGNFVPYSFRQVCGFFKVPC